MHGGNQKSYPRGKANSLAKHSSESPSALWNLPVYYMSLFTIPTSIASQLERVMRDFLWSKHDSDRGFHWVSGAKFVIPRRMVVWELDRFE